MSKLLAYGTLLIQNFSLWEDIRFPKLLDDLVMLK